jgi:GrpB-like predicted nucleotidyltransferase (UPF0157 family)
VIVIVNGALGDGKSETAAALAEHFDRAALLDLDSLALRPRDLGDPEQTEALFRLVRARVAQYRAEGVEHFVLDSVFECPEELSRLRRALGEQVLPVLAYRLVCSAGEHERRIRTRAGARPDGTSRLAWELTRGAELVAIQERAALRGDLGLPVPTDGRTPAEAAAAIWSAARRPVELAPYDALWPRLFEEERHRIAMALGRRALRIEHVGSTSVPGIAAKPVIDILLTVERLEGVAELIEPLRALDYAFIDHPDNVDRKLFRKGDERRTHNLHVVGADGDAPRDEVRFRDALRADPARRHAYEALKRELARRFPNDVYAYADAKGEFVARVLAEVAAAS